MSIRECAKSSEAFAKLHDAYCNREKALLEFKAKGGKVAGCMGADVPDEVLIAAGYLPIHVYADPDKPLTLTNVYLEFPFDPAIRATFEKLVDGTYYDLFDQLVISHTSDAELRIWLYLREIRRVERDRKVPPVHFVDWLMHRRMMYQETNEQVIERFRQTVESWTGRLITDEELIEAGRICNEDRDALRAMGELRHCAEPRINGSEALVIIGSALFMERAEHAKLVRQVVEDAQSWPVLTGKRVFVTGSNQESTDLYDIIEGAGAVIVGEDHDWGDRYYDRDMNLSLDPIKGIVDRYMLRQISSKKSSIDSRVRELDEAVAATDAKGVIFYLNVYDDSGSWDYPSQKKSLDANGIANAYFAKQQYPVAKNEGLPEQIATFIQGM
ncbi:MAG: 2-hydroxyacyl-CoA dehydratase family protein [Coriobacteriales bacterium]|nr:2-hydroxyacyl-CoA dehydratase family protein [Coriobacteriales bacterium]